MKAAGSTPWSVSAKRIAVPVPQEVLRPLSRRILLVEDQWSLIEIDPDRLRALPKRFLATVPLRLITPQIVISLCWKVSDVR